MRQSQWLRGGRIRLLRAAQVHKRARILELGAGLGHVAIETAERSGGHVLAVDLGPTPERIRQHPSVSWLTADVHELPVEDRSVDLVFAQFAWMWFAEPERVIEQVRRVLKPHGAVAFIEPDYRGMIEWPESIAVRDVWCEVLTRCGADPDVGRKLPCWFSELGMPCDVQFAERLPAADTQRFEFLLELPLQTQERKIVEQALTVQTARHAMSVVHLPVFFGLVSPAPGAN